MKQPWSNLIICSVTMLCVQYAPIGHAHTKVSNKHTFLSIGQLLGRNVDAVNVCEHNHLPLTLLGALLQTDGFHAVASKQ